MSVVYLALIQAIATSALVLLCYSVLKFSQLPPELDRKVKVGVAPDRTNSNAIRGSSISRRITTVIGCKRYVQGRQFAVE